MKNNIIMNSIILVSKNNHKIQEMNDLLKKENIKLIALKKEVQEPDLGSLELIAKEKARQGYAIAGKPVIVEDTGVYFNAFNEFPGIMAKRVFLGIGLKGLIALLKIKKNKKGYFKTVVCFFDGKKFKLFSGKLNGKFLIKERKPKANRLPYEKLFIPTGFKKALVEMNKTEKNKISHRAIATNKFIEWFKKQK
jgi:XTP/dITP diphosphohydrolase